MRSPEPTIGRLVGAARLGVNFRPLPPAKVPQHFRDYECLFRIPLGILI